MASDNRPPRQSRIKTRLVRKVGHSLVVTLPVEFTQLLDLRAGDEILVSWEENHLKLTPLTEKVKSSVMG